MRTDVGRQNMGMAWLVGVGEGVSFVVSFANVVVSAVDVEDFVVAFANVVDFASVDVGFLEVAVEEETTVFEVADTVTNGTNPSGPKPNGKSEGTGAKLHASTDVIALFVAVALHPDVVLQVVKHLVAETPAEQLWEHPVAVVLMQLLVDVDVGLDDMPVTKGTNPSGPNPNGKSAGTVPSGHATVVVVALLVALAVHPETVLQVLEHVVVEPSAMQSLRQSVTVVILH